MVSEPVAFKTYTFTPGKLTGQEFFLEKEKLHCRVFCFDQYHTFPKPKETVALRISLRGGYRAHDIFGHDDFVPKEALDVATGWVPQANGNFIIFPDESKEHLPMWIPERTRLIRVPLVKQYGNTVVNAYDLALGLDRFNRGDDKSVSIEFKIVEATDDNGKKGKRLVPANPLTDGVYYAYSLPDDKDTANYGFLFAVGTPALGSQHAQPVQGSVSNIQNIIDRHEELLRPPTQLPSLQNTYLWPRVKDYALLSQAVYKFGSVTNWELMHTDVCPIQGMQCFQDILGTSFQVQVYRSLQEKLLVVAFRGTEIDSASDWEANIENFFNGTPEQYEQAVAFVKQVVDKAGSEYKDKIVLTGHSLGGGLASYAALKWELPAVVFNAANLGQGLKHRVFANWYDFAALVTHINLKGDPVSQRGEQFGTVYTLDQPESLRARWESHKYATGPLNAVNDSIEPHFMENVILALQQIKK